MRETMLTTYRRGACAGSAVAAVPARRMSGVLAGLAFAALLAFGVAFACAFPAAAHAEHLQGADNWKVTFTSDEKMEDNFSQKTWADDLKGMQPGDDITFSVALYEEHSAEADWYMANEVLKSLEEGAKNSAAKGSAYSYQLTYTNPAGEVRTIYDSETVGGDDSNGLNDATNALEDFFFLDSLKHGETAHVDLKIVMDGETEQNAYFDTLAQVKMKFAVELNNVEPEKKTVTKHRTIVKTGDESTDLLPYYIIMTVSGLALLAIAIGSIRRRKQNQEGGTR